MLTFADCGCNKRFRHNDFMSGFCTAPQDIVYWALSSRKKMQPPAIWTLQQSIWWYLLLFDEFCNFNIQGNMLEHTHKPVKTKQRDLKSLWGLSFQKDAAIATTHTPCKKQPGFLWTKWMSRPQMEWKEKQMNTWMRNKGNKGVMQSIYGVKKAYNLFLQRKKVR